jgi:hypothetical protein
MGPTVLGRYVLERKVGAGGMGEVWLATDQRLLQPVALKQVSFGFLAESEIAQAQQRALREARLAAMLRQHAHVVPLYDCAIDDGVVWLVMEYLPSVSLRQLVMDTEPLPIGEAAFVGGSVASALEAAHARKILHRDVSPGNVLVGTTGRVKLTDFGIARLVSDASATRTHTVVGTIAFMAPELVNGHDATFSSDIFSLGATLYFALEGMSPYGADDNLARMLALVSTGNMRPPQNAGPLTPLLYSMLQINPAARPDPGTVRAELARYATRISDDRRAYVVSRTVPAAEPDLGQAPVPRPDYVPTGLEGHPTASGDIVRTPGKKRRSRAWIFAAIAAACVVLLALAGGVAYAVSGPLARLASGHPAASPTVADLKMPPDLRVFDTCGVYVTSALRSYGDFKVSRGTDLDSCEAHAVATPSDLLLVAVPFDTDVDQPEGKRQQLGPLTMIRGTLEKDPTGDECDYSLVLPDHSWIEFRALPYLSGKQTPIDLCKLAETAASSAAKKITTSGIPRSDSTLRTFGLASRDACAVVDQPTLASMPGLPTTSTSWEFARWGCLWNGGDGKPNLTVRFLVDDMWDLRAKAVATTVAGKDAYQRVFDGSHNKEKCRLDVAIKPSILDSSKAEAIRIFVDTSQPSAAQCAYAAKIGAAVVNNIG